MGIPSNEIHNFQLFAINLIDAIWRCHNKLVHDGTMVDIPAFSHNVNKIAKVHLEAWRSKPHPGSQLWLPPPPGVIKINSDMAIWENFVVVAIVCCNDQGVVLGAVVEKIAVGSLVEGEAIAAKLVSL